MCKGEQWARDKRMACDFSRGIFKLDWDRTQRQKQWSSVGMVGVWLTHQLMNDVWMNGRTRFWLYVCTCSTAVKRGNAREESKHRESERVGNVPVNQPLAGYLQLYVRVSLLRKFKTIPWNLERWWWAGFDGQKIVCCGN